MSRGERREKSRQTRPNKVWERAGNRLYLTKKMPLKMFETQKQINEEIFSFSLVNFCFYQAKGQQACPSHLLTKYQMTIF